MLSEVVIVLDENKTNVGSIADSVSILFFEFKIRFFVNFWWIRRERHFVAISQKFDPLMDFFLFSWSCFPTSKVKYDGEKPGANPTKLLIYLLELIHACSWVNPFRKKNFIFNANEKTALVVNKRRRTYRSETRLLWSFRLDDFLPDLLSYNLFFST